MKVTSKGVARLLVSALTYNPKTKKRQQEAPIIVQLLLLIVTGIILVAVFVPRSPDKNNLPASPNGISQHNSPTKVLSTKRSATAVGFALSKTADTVGKVPNASEPTYVASFPPLTATALSGKVPDVSEPTYVASFPPLTLTALYLNTLSTTEPTVTVSPISQTFTAIPDVMVRIKASKLNIRASARSDADILGQIPFDETVKAIGISSDGAWVLVNYQNVRGWISTSPDLVNISGSRSSLAVIVPTANPYSVSKSGNSTPRATARPRATTAVSTASCECNRDYLNCPNFASQGDAQACFNYCMAQTGRDVHKLDGNNDGRACENNRY